MSTIDVFLTVDTEVWPRRPGWPHRPLSADETCGAEVEAYFWGGGPDGHGLQHILEVLGRHGLKACFFVDPLFSLALGAQPLRRVVGTIVSAGQEVGLHLHPEWLTDPRVQGLPMFKGPLLSAYPESEQHLLMLEGLRLLEAAGARHVVAFRAGSWGADVSTLRAMRGTPLTIDTSLNCGYPTSFPSLSEQRSAVGAFEAEGVTELPLTYFDDGSRQALRPLQLCACSVAEMHHVLRQVHAGDPVAVVLVMHSFELVRVDDLDRRQHRVRPHRLVSRRFERLCRFLQDHSDTHVTRHFAEIQGRQAMVQGKAAPVRSSWLRTLGRYGAQAISRVY
jgi:peptidoglycan/xylan/chitin deacetylase (PgdA/CDA1 family)